VSALTDTTAASVDEADGRRGGLSRSGPGVGVAVRIEVSKLVSQWPLRAALVLCVVVPAGFAIMSRVESSHPTDTLFGRWSGTTGYATSLTVLTWAAAWGVPLLAGLFAGDIFSSEDRHGTWKTVLTRSMTRTRLFAGKAVAASLCVWFAFVVIGLVSLAAGLAAVGSSPLVDLSGVLMGSGRAVGLVAAAWGLCLVWSSVFVALGLLLSIAGRSGIIGVLGPLVLAILLQLLETVASGQIVRTVLPSTPADAWHGLFTAPVHVRPVVQAVVTSLIYTAIFAGSAWWLLRRRDFAAADAVPARARRTGVRIGVAAAAITAVLAGFSGVGPTALTAARLNASMAHTFGNLTDVRYLWQTGHPGDPTIPWHAACDRGGVAGATGGTPTSSGSANSKGAGDDWECIITDLRTSDGLGATTLDVTLKANGCYEAESPPGAVGALYVNNQWGKPFLNPLFAFDGCFGTP
jgi:ABC-2 type transport system permease protein